MYHTRLLITVPLLLFVGYYDSTKTFFVLSHSFRQAAFLLKAIAQVLVDCLFILLKDHFKRENSGYVLVGF